MIEHIKASIAAANAGRSKINADVLAIEGMSSPKVRHFLNNLCNFKGCNYLEIGSWKGSTVIAAAFKNTGHFTAIESFRKSYKPFEKTEPPREGLLSNKGRFKPFAPFTFHECDSWVFKVSRLPPGVNVYFYDGDHSPKGTAKAFEHFDKALADTFTLVMDDWNRKPIREATLKAIAKGYTLLYARDLFTPGRKNDPHENPTSWWNGLYVAVLRKGKR